MMTIAHLFSVRARASSAANHVVCTDVAEQPAKS
ncbi:unannotated protein [freshwater metagenome]|uniref:Unannotated protein n=1 Tax=freshwater metagenome TaxID=449393 RepID=A0A6J6I9D4_9ZZZZ